MTASDQAAAAARIESLAAHRKTVEIKKISAVLFFALFGDSKDERHRATVRWTVVTASDQAAAAARIESLAAHRKTVEIKKISAVLFFVLFGDSKDERHRATVRWTVVTASDQAAAAARIESLAARHKAVEIKKISAVLFFALSASASFCINRVLFLKLFRINPIKTMYKKLI